MKKRNYIYIVLFLGLLIAPSVDAVAQCAPLTIPCCPPDVIGCPVGCPPCTPVPLDAGLSALLVAGVAFGAKKLKGKVNL